MPNKKELMVWYPSGDNFLHIWVTHDFTSNAQIGRQLAELKTSNGVAAIDYDSIRYYIAIEVNPAWIMVTTGQVITAILNQVCQAIYGKKIVDIEKLDNQVVNRLIQDLGKKEY